MSRSILTDAKPIEVLDVQFVSGGLGDSVARLPAVQYLANKLNHIKHIRLFVQDYFVEAARHLLNLPPSKVTVFGQSQMEAEFVLRPSKRGIKTDVSHHTTMHTHLTDHAFHTLVDGRPEPFEQHASYPRLRSDEILDTIEIAPKQYIVVTTGFTSATREWLPSSINAVVDWIKSIGFLPVFLGAKQSAYFKERVTEGTFREEINFNDGLNLVDQTDLLQAAKIMEGARAVVGVDNGLLHLAATTDVPIVAGYTTVAPRLRMPYRHGELGWRVATVTPETCKNCQSEGLHVYHHDFRHCYYGDFQCVTELTPGKFIRELKHVLDYKK